MFHSIYKQWRTENVVTFSFLPENKSDARTVAVGCIPILRDKGHEWYLNMFSNDSKLRHVSSKWDAETRQIYSAEEAEQAEFLAEDDEMNQTDKPAASKTDNTHGYRIPQVSSFVLPMAASTPAAFHQD